MYLIIAVMMFIACPAFAGTNLLQNPGFESGDFSSWHVEGSATSGVAKDTPLPQAYFQPTQVIAHSGEYAAFNLTANFKRLGSVFSQDIDVLPETSYRVGFFCLHGHPSQQVKIYPQILIDSKSIGSLTITNGKGYGTAVADFQQIQGEFVTGQKQQKARVSFVLNAGGIILAGMSYDDFFVVYSQAAVNISPTIGTVGTNVCLSGWNYLPGEQVVIEPSTTTGNIASNENGAFAATFTIPVHTSGTLTIAAVGAASGKTARVLFYITPRGDFGDAPNSEIYPMNTGYFCKPDDFTDPLFLMYQAYFPIISHKTVSEECLGKSVRLEAGIYDTAYDEDGLPNIEPYKGKANQDSDDGLILPVDLKPEATNTVQFEITLSLEAPEAKRYVNILFDWNQDGHWAGNEWAVRNQGVDVPAGESRVITSHEFLAGTKSGGCWMRLVLTREPVVGTVWDGGGVFEYGESEDYLINIAATSDLWIRCSASKQSQLGQRIIYLIEYGNQGQALVGKPVITMNIPQGLTYLSNTKGAMADGNSLLWQFDKLYPEQQELLEAVFRVEPWAGENSTIVATCSISCDTNDTEFTNNMATCSTTIIPIAGNDISPVQDNLSVWPGDTNNDGVVNERDIFPIAVWWGRRGVARDNTILRWQAQSAIPWDEASQTYADANGDGRINVYDILPIGINWGKSHTVAGNTKGRQAPSLCLENIDHARYINIYKTMNAMLGSASQYDTDGSLDLTQALHRFIEEAAPPTEANSLGIKEKPLPNDTSLFQNYPNPFNPECWIPYELAERTQVMIRMYNISGQLVKTMDLGEKEAGNYTTQSQAAYWNGRNEEGEEIASGVSFYQMQAGSKRITKRAVVLK